MQESAMTIKPYDLLQGRRMETKAIGAEVYCELATSRRVLLRSDDDEHGIRGLYDPEAGVRYVVDECTLEKDVPHATAT